MDSSETRNGLKADLDAGRFFLLVEPPLNSPDEGAVAGRRRAADFAAALAAFTEFSAGFAFTAPPGGGDFPRENLAELLGAAKIDRHVVYLGGRGHSLSEQADAIMRLQTDGLLNFVPVSGDAVPGEGGRPTRRRQFAESVGVIQFLGVQGGGVLAGGVVNPFKYTPLELLAQYYKLFAKINSGAAFICAQAGWDMAKFQELRWFLSSRGVHHPTVARLCLLSPERADDIIAGNWPGVGISPDFQTILAKERHFSRSQFEAAQWRRLQIQAAGCRLLGYSGIQVAGIERPSQIATLRRRLTEAFEEFEKFENWREAYIDHFGRADMAPYPHRFLYFQNPLSTAHLDATPRVNRVDVPLPSWLARWRWRRRLPESAGAEIRAALAAKCPKKMFFGACGGCRPNGECEVGGTPCAARAQLAAAFWWRRLDILECE